MINEPARPSFLEERIETLSRELHRLTAGERQYFTTLKSIGDAIIATDAHSRITFLNPVAERLTE